MCFRAAFYCLAGFTSPAFTGVGTEVVMVKTAVAVVAKITPLKECKKRGTTVVMTITSLRVGLEEEAENYGCCAGALKGVAIRVSDTHNF